MATEVSCGQCHGRLLVETLGVVVACPHCGTHLSIPAPAPITVSITAASLPVTPAAPEPPPPQVTADPTPVPAPTPQAVAEFASSGIVDFATYMSQTAGLPAAPASAAVAADDLNSSSVFGGLDEQSNDPVQGWHSAPNLHLAAESSEDPSAETAAAPQPALFTAPLLNRDAPASAATEPTMTFEAASESTTAAPPDWMLSPSPDATVEFSAAPAEAEFHFSSTQQFSLGPMGETSASDAAPPSQFTAPPPAPPVFAAAAAIATASPVAVAPPSMPPTVESAPAAAPSAFPSYGVAPPEASPVEAPDLQPPTVAPEAAGVAAHQSPSGQKLLLMLLFIVASYASAVTIVVVYLLFFQIIDRSSDLESLPDLKPKTDKNGKIGWQYNPPKNDVAPGHVLLLGESRRFGNVKVTPLKVSRGRVMFEHHMGKSALVLDPSEPVLKLWVKFENVSSDQTFAPLDAHLLYTRNVIKKPKPSVQANGFIAVEADRRLGKSLFFMFDTPIISDFRIIGQDLDRNLKPGDSLETFVPSDENAPQKLTGDLVWRFQFRKGYHPTSKRGVTTLIDVRFNSTDITDERGA